MLLSVLPWIFSFPSALAAQPSAPAPISAPLRALEFGQLNFLHTTDTHGWLAGHLQEYVSEVLRCKL
jgi:2',3'-cyclic-nucleotide 2'-phosphodiesterase (5'-nucleotidase family)